MADERKSALDAALGQIERQFGKGAIMRMGDDARVPVAAISTGALSLDLALGVGGVPRGRIVELYGPESSGKTTLCYHIMAEAQKAGGTCAFIDAEHSMDPVYASRIGLNVDELLVSQPDNGEQALEIVEMLVRSGALDIVCIDSVAALVPKAEIEGEMGDSFVGLQARLMSQAMRKLAGTLNRTGTICLFTNQIREKIGVMFGSPETQPGGRALKFYASVRMDIRRIETLKDGSDAYGNRVRVKVVKNKVAPPFRQAEFDVIYGDGISWAGSVLDVGIEQNVISKSGSFLSFGETRLGQGRERAKAFLREHPDILQAILDKIQEGLEGVVVPGASLPAPGMAIGEVPPPEVAAVGRGGGSEASTASSPASLGAHNGSVGDRQRWSSPERPRCVARAAALARRARSEAELARALAPVAPPEVVDGVLARSSIARLRRRHRARVLRSPSGGSRRAGGRIACGPISSGSRSKATAHVRESRWPRRASETAAENLLAAPRAAGPTRAASRPCSCVAGFRRRRSRRSSCLDLRRRRGRALSACPCESGRIRQLLSYHLPPNGGVSSEFPRTSCGVRGSRVALGDRPRPAWRGYLYSRTFPCGAALMCGSRAAPCGASGGTRWRW